jgi:hypothetical protein
MKLTNLTAKLKSNVVRVLAAATLVGGVLVAAAPAAEAQRVFVRVGGPRYFAPAPVVVAPPVVVFGRPGFYGYDHRDWRFHHDFYRGYRR